MDMNSKDRFSKELKASTFTLQEQQELKKELENFKFPDNWDSIPSPQSGHRCKCMYISPEGLK